MRTMFDLDKHGEDAFERALLRLPPGSEITLAGSGLRVVALGGGVPGYKILGNRGGQGIIVDKSKLRARSSAASYVASVHREVIASGVG